MEFAKDHKKKLLLAAVGGIALVAAIAVTVVLVTDNSDSSPPPQPNGQVGIPMTFNEFLDGHFRSKSFNGSWWSDTEIQWSDTEGNLVLWNFVTNTVSILVPKELLAGFGSGTRFLGFANNDKSLQLFASNVESIWRHSFTGTYSILDSASGITYPLVPTADSPDDTRLQFAEWLPHPTQDRIVFVYNNDIYVRNVVSDVSSTIRITSDGLVDNVYNGIPDWVYEEEVLGTNEAQYASTTGSFLAYAQFDDTDVQEFYYTKYGSPDAPLENQYPTEIMIKYPKVGVENPTLRLWVKSLAQPGLDAKEVAPPADVVAFGEYLYTAAEWSNVDGSDIFNVIWMDRVQSRSSVSRCVEGTSSWECVTQYTLTEADGWLDLFQPPVYHSSGQSLLQIQSTLVASENLHYRQLALVTDTTNVPQFLTSGNFVVTQILGWDEAAGTVYFMGTAPGEPGKREFYSVSDTPGSAMTCITCSLLMPGSGEACKYSSVQMSPDFAHYVQTCSGPDIPEVVLRSTANGAVLAIIEDNIDLRVKLIGRAIADVVVLDLVAAGGYHNFARLLFPPTYDSSRMYPAIVDVYAGPDSQSVTHRWSMGWADYLTTNYDIIYILIDGRGSGLQSNEYLFEVNRHLGSVEMDDQIAITRQLQDMYPPIDRTRTGIWGWSYGGYATLMTLIRDVGGVFSCGISVAPVTNWLFYDTIYTERYMGLPTAEDNLAGYDESSVLNKVESLRGKVFQLNHGVADDNVHYQQSMMLIKALELADIQFDQQSYPDENHGLGRVSRFLYHSFDIFWSNCMNYEIA